MQIIRWKVRRAPRRPRLRCTGRIALGLLLVAAIGAPIAAQLPQDLQLTPMGLSLSSPLAVRSAFDGTGRLFIAERSGALLVHRPGVGLDVFLDLTSSVDPSGEGGLLGVAFHPRYRNNGYFFVSYTRSGPGIIPLTTVV